MEAAAREQAERKDGLTLAKALREYVEKKRRVKDGLPLKAYTRAEIWPCSSPAELRRLVRSLPMANCMPSRTSCSGLRPALVSQSFHLSLCSDSRRHLCPDRRASRPELLGRSGRIFTESAAAAGYFGKH